MCYRSPKRGKPIKVLRVLDIVVMRVSDTVAVRTRFYTTTRKVMEKEILVWSHASFDLNAPPSPPFPIGPDAISGAVLQPLWSLSCQAIRSWSLEEGGGGRFDTSGRDKISGRRVRQLTHHGVSTVCRP